MKIGEMTIHEIVRLTGITARALRYYEEIGLLKSVKRTNTNCRIYSKENYFKLLHILFYKEVGFTLDEITKLLSKTIYSNKEFLERYLKLLEIKSNRTEELTKLIDDLLVGEKRNNFTAFTDTELSDTRELYKGEIILRWSKYK